MTRWCALKWTLPCRLQLAITTFPPHTPFGTYPTTLPYSLCSLILPSLLHPPPRSLPHLPTSSFLFTPPHRSPPFPGTMGCCSAVHCQQQHGRPLPPSLGGRSPCCRHCALPLATPLHPSTTRHHPSPPLRNPLRHDGILQCPADNSTGDLFLPALEAGAVAAGTVPWHIIRGKFLLLHCVRGQVGTGAWHTTRGKFLLLHCVRGQVGTGEGWYQTGQLRVGAGDGGCWGRWFLGKVVAGEGGCWGKVGTGEGGCQGRWVPGKVGTGRYWGRWLGAAFPPCSLSRPSPSPLPPPSLLLSIFNPPNPPPSLFQTTLPPDQQPAPFHLSEVVRNYNMRVAPSPPCPLSPHTPDQQPGSLHQESPAASWSFRPHAHSALPPLRGGAQLQHALRSLFPPQEQISNRVLCIKNHLLLAGLLSRTLIVPFHHSEVVRNYNMHVALDVEHLRRCFGKVVFTTAEYRRKYVKPINVTEVVCWHGPKGACREEDKELLLNCPAPETMNTPASVLVGGDGEALRKSLQCKYVQPINVMEVVCWHGPKGACREEDKELLLNCPAPETMNTPASVLVGGDGEALRKGVVAWPPGPKGACREEDKELMLKP
ncbi:unnamed protein product [Closterium sp. NIES-64]|nr:unnamed protein product [Closterium sp. NIES-64]